MNPKRLTLLFAFVLLLQACGVSFWYNRLDWVILWQVDDYVELTDEQELQLENLILQKLEWHRATQLKQYVSLLEQLIQDIESGSIAQNYSLYDTTIRRFFTSVQQEIAEDFVLQVSNLNDQQIASIFAVINERAQERDSQENLSREERLEQREEAISDSITDWIGKLSKSQRLIIKDWASRLQPTHELRLAYNQQWQNSMQQALASRNSSDGQERLHTLIFNAQQLKSSELIALEDANQALQQESIIALAQSLTKKQKKRIISELKDYKEDFIDLMED